MNANQFPLIVTYGYPMGDDGFYFLGRDGMIEIKSYQKELTQILPYCNGYIPLKGICSSLTDIDSKIIKKLVNICQRYGILVDSRQLYKRFHLDSVNPGYFMHNLSASKIARLTRKYLPESGSKDEVMSKLPLLSGTTERVSTRHFTSGLISSEILSRLLASMYRVGHTRSVPSGGGLYPLTLYVFLYRETEELKPGIYKYNHYTLELDWIKPLPSQDSIERAFETRELLVNAVGSIVITADLERSTSKYANRGYRYTLLEAGHVAQNAYLFCTTDQSENLGIVEYGGFLDKEIADLLELQFPRFAPIVSLIFGIKNEKVEPLKEMYNAEQVRKLDKALVGNGKPIVDYGIYNRSVNGLQMAQWTASAQHRNPNYMDKADRNETAFATGTLMNDAAAKVLGEAYERYVCFKTRADILARASELKTFCDPRIYAHYDTNHPVHARYDLKPFCEDQSRAWVYGQDHSGRRIAVPIDLVYYSRTPRQSNYCYIPSSSGVAAHPDLSQARVNAMLELIERDAIAVHWYAMLTPSKIPNDFLPATTMSQKIQWEKIGWEVYVLDLTLDSTPVCMVLLVNHKKYPVLSAGAASAFTMQNAIRKAFLEAEYMAISWQGGHKEYITPNKVCLPHDHGVLYASNKYFHEVEYLLAGLEIRPQDRSISLEDLNKAVEPVIVRMDDGKYPLTVARVLSQHLLPLTFGYETEHFGHERLKTLNYQWRRKFPSMPHMFS